MGGAQTYEVSYDHLQYWSLGLCTRFEESNYYFLDEEIGFYYLPKISYEKVIKDNENDGTKILKLPLKVICKYDCIIMSEFDDSNSEIWVNIMVIQFLNFLLQLLINMLLNHNCKN